MLAGVVIISIPTLTDRPKIDRWEGFHVVRHENVTLANLDFNIVTLEEKQNLHIFYAAEEIKKGDTFLMFIIPYLGTLTNPEGDGFSIPNDWQTYHDIGLKTTILYNFFDCGDKSYCNDQLNMYFDFDEKIDSKQYYTHSINIPFLSPHPSEIITARNKILEHIPNGYWKESMTLTHNFVPQLTITVLDDSTQYNPIPDGYLKSHNSNRTGVTNSVMVWDIPEKRITFHLDYIDTNYKWIYDIMTTSAIFLFGIGIEFRVISFSELTSSINIKNF